MIEIVGINQVDGGWLIADTAKLTFEVRERQFVSFADQDNPLLGKGSDRQRRSQPTRNQPVPSKQHRGGRYQKSECCSARQIASNVEQEGCGKYQRADTR